MPQHGAVAFTIIAHTIRPHQTMAKQEKGPGAHRLLACLYSHSSHPRFGFDPYFTFQEFAVRMNALLRAAQALSSSPAASICRVACSSLPVESDTLGQLWWGPASQSSCRPFSAFSTSDERKKWQYLQSRGADVNPCNSPLHPAAQAGLPVDGEQEVMSVQDAYAPKSQCFGCGPAHPDGLQLRSKRIPHGLEAHVTIPRKYCAFPGIINGGIVSTLMECHGNWTAVIALMDKACLPKPPLTLTASVFISYKEPTPPDTPLVIRSKVMDIKETYVPGHSRASVEVDVSVYEKMEGGPEKLLVHGTVMCKRMGALRDL